MIPIVIHIVKPGESLIDLSSLYDVPVKKLIADNEIESQENILPNQAIVIDTPGAGHEVREREARSIEVNGYVYPSIKPDVLEKTLPDLTYLCIFSYAVNMDGNLDLIDDRSIIETALTNRVAPVMVITNKYFSSYIAREILNNRDAQNRLMDNIVYVLKLKNYFGLNVDFEYIFPGDRLAYNEFLKRLTDLLRPMGFMIMTSLAPKVSTGRNKMLCEAHDYKIHGEIADRTVLMTYEWGYTYSAPMAVSPVNKVMQVLDYASNAIPPEKTMIGIPNYGYDWRLPWVEGTAATAVSNNTAIKNAMENKAEIRYDRHTQTPYFYYYDQEEKLHVTWFEDARSIYAKLDTVNRYRIAGVSFWTANKPFSQNKLVLHSMCNISKVIE